MEFTQWFNEGLEVFDEYEPTYLKGIFDMLVYDQKHNWDLQNGSYYSNLLEKAKTQWPYRGVVYRTISVPINGLQIWKLKEFPALQQQMKTFNKNDSQAIEEFKRYVLNFQEMWDHDTESWSKSLNGVKYFKENQRTRAYNVILKAWMENGLDLYAFGQALGIGPESKQMTITRGAEEVVGSPIKIEIYKVHLLKNHKRVPKPGPLDGLV